MRILIAPYSIKMKDKKNPKEYPWFQSVIDSLCKKHDFYQVGVSSDKKLENIKDFYFDLKFNQLCSLIKDFDTWISVDSYFQHIGTYVDKRGIVVWSKSDPKIFGSEKNINIIRDHSFLRPNQFIRWEEEEYNISTFVHPEQIVSCIEQVFSQKKQNIKLI